LYVIKNLGLCIRIIEKNIYIIYLKKRGAMTLVLKVDSICSTFTKLYLVAFGATPALLKRHVNPLFPSKA
jgi:hypothetical protein